MIVGTTILAIQKATAKYFGISLENLQSEKRTREFSHPRMIAMYLAYSLLGMGSSSIGRQFKRDHTTVLHAIKWVGQRPRLDTHVENIRKNLREEVVQ